MCCSSKLEFEILKEIVNAHKFQCNQMRRPASLCCQSGGALVLALLHSFQCVRDVFCSRSHSNNSTRAQYKSELLDIHSVTIQCPLAFALSPFKPIQACFAAIIYEYTIYMYIYMYRYVQHMRLCNIAFHFIRLIVSPDNAAARAFLCFHFIGFNKDSLKLVVVAVAVVIKLAN